MTAGQYASRALLELANAKPEDAVDILTELFDLALAEGIGEGAAIARKFDGYKK